MSLLRGRSTNPEPTPETNQFSIPPPLHGGPVCILSSIFISQDAIVPPPIVDDKGQIIVPNSEIPPNSPMKITETIKQLAQMLEALTPTKDSIKVTKNWIMEQPGISYIPIC